jgi:hypothetical protein
MISTIIAATVLLQPASFGSSGVAARVFRPFGTVGPSVYTTATDMGGTKPWTNPNNVLAADGAYATCTANGIVGPNILELSDPTYGTVPPTATIDGIEVTINGHAAINRSGISGVNENYQGVTVRLFKVTGSPGVGKGNIWTTTDTTWTYGGSSDLWSTTWTPAQVNSTSFGMQLLAEVWSDDHPATNRTISVDWAMIKVYYH